MAYFTQEQKKAIAPAIKNLLKKYNLKGTLAVRHHSTAVLNISGGEIDFLSGKKDDHIQVNIYRIEDHYTGKALDFLKEAKKILMTGNHDRSDIMTDYFDVGWYVDINIGQYDKPYKLTTQKQTSQAEQQKTEDAPKEKTAPKRKIRRPGKNIRRKNLTV